MAIGIVGTTASLGFVSASSPQSGSIDAGTQTNRVLYAVMTGDAAVNPNVTGITYNSVAMTKLSYTPAGVQEVEIWRLIAPASGSNTLEVTWDNGTQTGRVYCFTYEDVDQTTPEENISVSSVSPGTSLVTAVTGGAAGDRKIGVININGDVSGTFTANTAADAGATYLTTPLTLTIAVDGVASTGSSQNVGGSWTGSQRAEVIGMNLKQAAAGGATLPLIIQYYG